MAGEMFALIAAEDQHAEPASLSAFAAGANSKLSLPGMIDRMHFVFRRMAEWMEALIHWEVHWMSATAPITNQPTEGQRELTHIGVVQAGFAGYANTARNGGDFAMKSWRKRSTANRIGGS